MLTRQYEQLPMSKADHSNFNMDTSSATNLFHINPMHSLNCPFCPTSFSDKFQLKAHISQFHGKQMPFSCSLCGKGYLSAQGLDHHKSVHEGKKFSCPVCDIKMNQKGNIKQHLRRVHKSDQCMKCLQVYSIKDFSLHFQACRGNS